MVQENFQVLESYCRKFIWTFMICYAIYVWVYLPNYSMFIRGIFFKSGESDLDEIP